MNKHRNSQKRIYIPNAIYFITTATKDRIPFFENDFFCEVFIQDLTITEKLKNFRVYGYKVNPDHIHLLIQPMQENISEIMRSLKTNFSRNINRQFTNSNMDNIPAFEWQHSFHDHYIRDEMDFFFHLEYIKNQWIKHKLSENKYCFVQFP